MYRLISNCPKSWQMKSRRENLKRTLKKYRLSMKYYFIPKVDVAVNIWNTIASFVLFLQWQANWYPLGYTKKLHIWLGRPWLSYSTLTSQFCLWKEDVLTTYLLELFHLYPFYLYPNSNVYAFLLHRIFAYLYKMSNNRKTNVLIIIKKETLVSNLTQLKQRQDI